MYNVIIIQLVSLAKLIGGSKKADSLNDEHHGLHVHHHDQWVHPNTVRNDTDLRNMTQKPEDGIKDVLGIVKKEEIPEHIMKKVKDILGVAKAEESGDIIGSNTSTDQPKNYVELYLDLIDSMNEVREAKESDVFILTNISIDDDSANIDYTEYNIDDYFDEEHSDYEGDDDYFDNPYDERSLNNPETEESKNGLLKKGKEPKINMKIPNTAFPELLTDLLYA